MMWIELSKRSKWCSLIFCAGLTTGVGLILLLASGLCHSVLVAECKKLEFEHKPSLYYGPGEYFLTCPDNSSRIRCYHYHRHWVCEKGETLYWDRRLESAARMACDCPLPEDTVPASPAISGKPKKGIFGPKN